MPNAFLDPVADPVGDLVSRYVRTHGPFTAQDAATRLGLGIAIVTDALRRLASDRRVVEGEFRPGATGSEWVDAEVLRRLRSRSLAALRSEVEPVAQQTLGRFLPDWQHVGQPGTSAPGLRGIDGVVSAIDQLAGVALPASTWESLVLPSRVRDYSPAMLDELTTTGEVLWSGRGELSGGDGWLALHLADTAPLTLAEPTLTDQGELHGRVIDALAGGGAFFFRQLATALAVTGPVDDKDLALALWDLTWAGLVSNDTLAPLRSRLGATTTRPRATPPSRALRGRGRASAARSVAASLAATAPPTVAGRWSLLPAPEASPTVRATALAEQLLERHGIVTRGAVMSEGVVGGFPTAYKVLSGLEETGRTRRGYFIEGLGAAQFATPATVDRLRAFAGERDTEADAADRSAHGAHPRRDRPREPVRRRARLARRPRGTARRPPPRPQAGRTRRAGRRRPRALRRARRQDGARLHRRPGATGCGGRVARGDDPCHGRAAPHREGGRGLRDRHPARRRPHGIRIRADAAGPAAARLGERVPEGDTVWKTAQLQNAALAGATLTGFDLRVPKFATADLTGETVHEVVSRGKHLLHRIGEFTLHTHLKMEGAWRTYAPGEKWRRPAFQARAVLTTADVVSVGFELGTTELLPTADEETVVGHLGPDLLGPDWDAGEAARRARRRSRRSRSTSRPSTSATWPASATSTPTSSASCAACCRPGRSARSPTSRRSSTWPSGCCRPTRIAGCVPRRATCDPATRSWVYGRRGRPCRRCGTRLLGGELGRDHAGAHRHLVPELPAT